MGAGPDPPSGARERRPVGESLRRGATDRYRRVSQRWSPRARSRADVVVEAGVLASRTFVASRLFGLAAEMAFWSVFALPWVLLGLVAGLSSFQAWFGLDVVSQFESELTRTASQFFSGQTMSTTVRPMIQELFSYGSGGVSVVSFLVALWSGSRLVATSVQGVVLVSGDRYEGYMRTRARALVIYAVGLVGLMLALILLVLGPDLLGRLLGTGGRVLYFGLLVVLAAALLLGLFLFSPRRRPPLRATLPGALAGTLGLVLALVGLRVYLTVSIESGSLYAVVGAPIAVLLWAYVTSYVVLLGALLNRVLAATRARSPDRLRSGGNP